MRNFLHSLLHKDGFYNSRHDVEYINLNLITILAAVLYISHGIVLTLFAYSHLLFVTQTLSVFICIGAFVANRYHHTRVASIMLIVLICMSTNIWAYTTNVGGDMRWYAVLALCPLYFFSTFKRRDQVALTIFVVLTFLSASIINYYHEPLATMPNPELYNTASSIVVMVSIAFELVLYKYVNTKRDSELERIGTILANIECGIIIVDAQTREILDINPVAERLCGEGKEAFVGRRCHELICSAQDGACPVMDLHKTLDRSEQMLLKADGGAVPIIKTVSKIWYNDRPALLESFTDISVLKEAEEKLRLMEITERSNRAKSEFLSRMSHEMRTPMNAIIGMTKIAENADDVDRLKYCLSAIETSSTHLLGIINDILDMSKIEAGKFEIDSVPLYIEALLIKIYSLISEQTERKNIKLNIYMGEHTAAQYLGDELRLVQVVTNLMSNAVKFTPEKGAITLTVDAIRVESERSALRFSVTDTGIGISDEQLDRLFHAFEQADGSITRQFGGTGLGLAISKNIVEKMGGRIWAESEPGRGSTFAFEVTLPHGEQNAAGSTLPPDAKVLVADEDAQARAYCASLIGRHGLRADEAETAQDMHARIRLAREAGAPYDAIFLAYAEMDESGLEALGRAIADADKSKMFLIAPPRVVNSIEHAARDAGFGKLIPGPLFPCAVFEAINSAMGCPVEGAQVEQGGAGTVPDFSGGTLLLAEDMAINREIFVTLLEDTGIAIEIAENGLEAVEKFKASPARYDVIVMDIQMPRMNGYEATKAIRALDVDRAADIPIIAMTADAFREDIELCLACGMNDHLKKPIEIEMVFEKLSLYCTPESRQAAR